MTNTSAQSRTYHLRRLTGWRILTILLACAALLHIANPALNAAQRDAERFRRIAGQLAAAMNTSDFHAIHRQLSPTMQQALPLDKLKPFIRDLSLQFGRVERLDEPLLTPPNQALIVAQCQRRKMDIKIILDENDKIAGMWFSPHKSPVPIVEKHQTTLTLPFEGPWKLLWGGDTKELNRHHGVRNQKFAIDFIAADNYGRTRRGSGLHNRDYFAYGKTILAPADGVVTDVINGVRDNQPGSVNPYSALGNAVLIQHRPNEVSVLAHLRLNSIRVKVGQKLTRGQPIGICGNSGNSSEPHLHYHIQNTPIIQDATGIKPYFTDLIVTTNNRQSSPKLHSPIKDQIVESKFTPDP